MSVNEIIQELPKLSAEDRFLLRQELDDKYFEDFGETPEMLAAIDEGLRSLREEPTCTIEDLREDMRKWNLGSKFNPTSERSLTARTLSITRFATTIDLSKSFGFGMPRETSGGCG